MKTKNPYWGKPLAIALSFSALSFQALSVQAEAPLASEFIEELKAGSVTGDIRLRAESVDQDNGLEDADSLTLRTRLTYTSGTVNGFSALLEMEDVRIVGGVDDYTVGPTGFKPGEFSVIADPETTELDQAFVQYKQDALTLKLGRQVIAHHDQRFVGHVGWRQDRQTFDAVSAGFQATEQLSINYNYITQRNRIFAEAADLDAKDHLLNATWKLPIGELVGFTYLLEVDNGTDNALDTYGFKFSGSSGDSGLKFLYTLAAATQEAEAGSSKFDADYLLVEAGVALPLVTFKLSHELLGSDDGAYGFATPLATLHKFNGWTDQFLATPAQGLADTYLTVSSKIGRGSWTIVYHDFSADEDTATIDDFGEELDLQFVWPFSKNLSVGIKYGAYEAGDAATGLVDTDKFWLWTGLTF